MSIYYHPLTSSASTNEQIQDLWNQVKLAFQDTSSQEICFILTIFSKKRQKKLVLLNCLAACTKESRKFSSIIKLISYLARKLPLGKITTKRDFHYQDVKLFQNQEYSNSIIDLFSTSLNLSTQDNLLIYSSQKGLCYGNCKFSLNNQWFDLTYSSAPILIPHILSNHILTFTQPPIAIIIIEKDAVFKSFTTYLTEFSPSSNFLVVTGKGFPDKLTKKFIELSSANLNIPILTFVDSDVYGLSIFKNYMFSNSAYLENIILAGVFLLEYTDGWLNITSLDLRRMIGLVKSTSLQTHLHKELAKLHRELTRSLLLLKKSEMNVINHNCSHYIFSKSLEYLKK